MNYIKTSTFPEPLNIVSNIDNEYCKPKEKISLTSQSGSVIILFPAAKLKFEKLRGLSIKIITLMGVIILPVPEFHQYFKIVKNK